MKKLLPAVVASGGLILAAPFLRSVQRFLREAVPDGYIVLLAGVFAVGVLAALAAAVLHIRGDWGRYGLLAAALGMMAVQLFGWNRGDANTDAVERMHFLFYGLLAYLFLRGFRDQGGVVASTMTLIAVATVGTLDEWLQWLVPVRTGELFDVILNAYAGLCGLLFSLAVDPFRSKEWRSERADGRRLAWLAVAFLLVFGGFVDSAHLGYLHQDPEIGHFHSYFSPVELPEINRRRAEAWRREPPGPLVPLAVEDYFRSEAGWRVSHRNGALDRGDTFSAWKENLILEKYYSAFLDLGHRLGPQHRSALEADFPRPDPYVYVSPADQGRVFVSPSRGAFWGWTVGLVGLVGLASLRGARRSRPIQSGEGGGSEAPGSP